MATITVPLVMQDGRTAQEGRIRINSENVAPGGCRYHSRGYTNCYVTHIEGMETGNLKVRVMEGKVGGVNIVQVDADGNPTGKPGNIPPHIVLREVPFKARAPLPFDNRQFCPCQWG